MGGLPGATGWLGVVLGTPDPVGLGRFYAALLGGTPKEEDPAFVTLTLGGTHYLAFQREPDHVPPIWPSGPGDPQVQVHLDVGVGDLSAAVDAAVDLGGRLATFQPQDDVRVLLDPAGHPFCLYLDVD